MTRLALFTLAAGLCLATGGPRTAAEPAVYVESNVLPPGWDGGQHLSDVDIHVWINADVRGLHDACTETLKLVPVTPGAPEFPNEYGICPEFTTLVVDGPLAIGDIVIKVPAAVPDGSIYQIQFLNFPRGLRDVNGHLICVTAHNGYLTVRNKPFLRGDLDDDGAVTVGDAVLSLRLALNLIQPTPYQAAAGDFNRDAQLTIADTVSILRKALGLDVP